MTAPSVEKIEWFRKEFRPHFEKWVFGPIDRLVSSPDALIGFIFMTCAIDYLAGFYWGIDTKKENKKAYREFIDIYFETNKYDSKGLYDSLRNGLVHLFTIKGRKYTLTQARAELHLQTDSVGQIILNAESFRDDLVVARNKYFNDVEGNSELMDKLRERINRDGFLGPMPIIVSNSKT